MSQPSLSLSPVVSLDLQCSLEPAPGSFSCSPVSCDLGQQLFPDTDIAELKGLLKWLVTESAQLT